MRIGLGAWPRVTLAEARKAAFANRCLRDEGRDPLAAKRQRAHEAAKEARVPTFVSAIDEVIALRRPTWKDADTLAGQFRASLERYAGALGPIQVSRITTADVMQALAPHWHSVPAAADTARRRISAVLQWAIGQGYRSDDPAAKRAVAAALGAQAHRTEHHRAMPYAEVGQAVAAVHARSRASPPRAGPRAHGPDRHALERGTGRDAWNEIDLDARTWTIPAGRMKAKRTHRVPLSGRAMAILDEARTLGPATGDALVFPGASKGRPLAGATLLNLLARAGLDTTLHGFRSAFANWARERTNVPSAVAEAALAHTVNNAAEAAYATTDYFDKRVDLMERWARFIAAAERDWRRGQPRGRIRRPRLGSRSDRHAPARQARDDTVEGRPPVAVPDRARRTSAKAPGDGPGVVGGRAERVCRERLCGSAGQLHLPRQSFVPAQGRADGDGDARGPGVRRVRGLRHLVLRSAARGHRRLP